MYIVPFSFICKICCRRLVGSPYKNHFVPMFISFFEVWIFLLSYLYHPLSIFEFIPVITIRMPVDLTKTDSHKHQNSRNTALTSCMTLLQNMYAEKSHQNYRRT